MRLSAVPIIGALVLLPAGGSQALDGIVLGGGEGTSSSQVSRIGLLHETGHRWIESDRGHAELYVEAALHYWSDGDDNLTGISIVPTLVYQFNSSNANLRPLVEYGVGLLVNNHTSLHDHNLSTQFQFENRLGLGMLLGQHHRLVLRVSHASNGGISTQNDGFDAVTLNYQYRW